MSARRVLVVGSGPSGIHFAQSALARGFEVTMVDAGRVGPPPVLPAAGFEALKEQLDDPAEYFLGSELEGLVLPSADKEFYGFPPSKNHVFDSIPDFKIATEGFEPLFSFAKGGLAEAWTGGSYPFNDDELEAFPFSYSDIAPYYAEIAQRIGVTGDDDDLAQFHPFHDALLPPLKLDEHSTLLMSMYEMKKAKINRDFGAYLGRTRVATLSKAQHGRGACEYLGRCLMGCPVGALYTPSQSMRELERQAGFSYMPGLEAVHFKVNDEGRISALVVRPISGGAYFEMPVQQLALAAGTLASAAIVLRSVRAATGRDVTLHGLMDNRQALVPFLNLRMLGKAVPESSYQYHLLGMGLRAQHAAEFVHCQVTTLKTALVHPIVQGLPLDLKTSLAITRATRTALGVVNVNFHDTRREGNSMSLDRDGNSLHACVRMRYAPDAAEPARLEDAMRRVRKTLWALGCFVPPGMQHVRPMGASVHYAGLFPMSESGGEWTSTPSGQSRAFENLYFADGSTFPFLPAKNITFTLMANAARVADSLPA